MHIDQEVFFSSAFGEIGDLLREELVKEAFSGAVGRTLTQAVKRSATRAPKAKLTGPPAPRPTVPTAAAPAHAGRVATPPPVPRRAATPPPVPRAAPAAAAAAAPAAAQGGVVGGVRSMGRGAADIGRGIAGGTQAAASSLAKGVRGWRQMGLSGGIKQMGEAYRAGGVRGVMGTHMGRVGALAGGTALAVPAAAGFAGGRAMGQRQAGYPRY